MYHERQNTFWRSNHIIRWIERRFYLSVIESDVTNFQGDIDAANTLGDVPKENFQATLPIVDAKVYQYGDDIVVEIEGKYWLYETINNRVGVQMATL